MSMSAYRMFLPLADRHAVPLEGLEPENIKKNARNVIRNPSAERSAPHTTILNFIVKALGFEGNAGAYAKEHYPRLQNFMADKGLMERVDVFERNPMMDDFYICMSRKDVAERLFIGKRPQRIFTGYGADGVVDTSPYAMCLGKAFDEADVVDENTPCELAMKLAYRHRFMAWPFMNLLGDPLCQPRINPPVPCQYLTDKGIDPECMSKDRAKIISNVSHWLDRLPEGWVQVVPYNENLVFLKATDGRYDFVVRSLRNVPPPAHLPELMKDCDWPRAAADIVQFAHDYYFDQEQYEQRDRHDAEIAYYRSGGRGLPEYPGQDAILRRYLSERGRYRTPRECRAICRPGFSVVAACDIPLHMSDLIAVHQFREFVRESDYLLRRLGLDHWNLERQANDDPVCCDWYDAMAYCAWRSEREKVSLRLPSLLEYQKLIGAEVPRVWQPTKIRVTLPARGAVPELKANVNYAITEAGLATLNADDFGEWLIREDPYELTGKYTFVASAAGLLHAPKVEYAYKGMRCGFRVCYE
ncbi:MAG: SUMF1/EgtB/PvdO family nonheme iron enzyme [Phycisphaeraceae bacterium]|nr:SUMF1/EgtB/PvdO family nonheme iron enzyme [Phycisphaeraceae bacterium]